MKKESSDCGCSYRLVAGLLLGAFGIVSFCLLPPQERALNGDRGGGRGRRLVQVAAVKTRGDAGETMLGESSVPLEAEIQKPVARGPCRIHILNVTKEFGIPKCVPEDHFVTRMGVIWANYDMRWWTERRERPELWAGHEMSQHAGPYFVSNAIRESSYYTSDIEEADAIIVDDYCYKMWWLSNVHSGAVMGKDSSWHVAWRNISDVWQPHDLVRHVHASLAAMPRFRRTNGAELAFFATHPILTSFTTSQEDTNSLVHALGCNEFSHSLQLVVDGVMRYTCHSHVPKQRSSFLVVPYSAPKARGTLPTNAERDILLFFLGGCALSVDDRTTISIGKNIRKLVVDVVNIVANQLPGGQTVNMVVECTPPAPPRPHGVMQAQMEHSRFCLVLPGDTASSRRLTEVILAGCIPVLVGPPWHSLPLADYVDYGTAAIFIEVTELKEHFEESPILDSPVAGEHALSVFDANWWIPDVNLTVTPKLQVPTVADILPALLAVPEAQIVMHQAVLEVSRGFFTYPRAGEDMANTAAQAVVDNLCARVLSNPDLM